MYYQQFNGNKFHAKSTEYAGIVYHSKLEAGYAQFLDLLLKGKKIKSWTRQIPIELDVNGFHIARYYVDFQVNHLDNTIEYVETKGFETEIFRLKRKLFEALYDDQFRSGEMKYTIIKQLPKFYPVRK